jgi:pyruvate dehydrogenase E1 component alpha subunit
MGLGGHSMSDPGTTYRTREEIQNMRSSNDAIQGLKSKLLEWGVVSENELKDIDKQARKMVDDEVAQAEKSPERNHPFPTPPLCFPCLVADFGVAEGTPKNLFEDIYVRGTEPPAMRGRILEENYSY